LAGACIVWWTTATVADPRVGAAAPSVTLQQEWIQTLNDAPCGVVLSSPTEFVDSGGGPAVEVGDRQGLLYAFGLDSGTIPAGWGKTTDSAGIGSGQGCDNADPTADNPIPDSTDVVNGVEVPENPPIDSTASVNPVDNTLYVDGGNAAVSTEGGYYAYSPGGAGIWNQVVTNPPTDSPGDTGVLASPTLADGASLVEAGSLGQETYALQAADGSPAVSWPQFSADSVFSTAASGDLYGTGSDNFVAGGASSAGFAYGMHYSNGGHLRIYNDRGGLICAANTTEEIDSSPAVGPILANGAYGIATGTGSFFGGSDENTVKVYDTQCHQIWSDTLDGTTGGSPALADIEGNGQLAVLEGTVTPGSSGTVWALNASTGAPIWHTDVGHQVIGSVTTADFGEGYQDVIVPTSFGLYILDGRSGEVVADVDDMSGHGGVPLNAAYGFQNAALVTADSDGTIGITVAGYFALSNSSGGVTNEVQGMVQHFEVTGSSAQKVDAAGGWPQFHHDGQLTGMVGGGSPLGVCQRPDAAQNGYLTVASDGGIFAFGHDFCGSTGSLTLNKPVVGMTAVPGRSGYWLVASDGGIFTYGGAGFFGSTGSLSLNAPVVGMAATPDGNGYWLVAADGGIFDYGDAPFYGSAASVPGQHIVGLAATPDGLGYWEVSASGQVFPFGDATPNGDLRGVHLNAPIVGITPDPVTGGYWLIGADGGVFAFGAPFYGSTGNLVLNQPVVAMQATADGGGYWFVASDGGIFSYGDAAFKGSMGGQHLNQPMVGMFGF
jgi:outer membrane protein assembly factor BamB